MFRHLAFPLLFFFSITGCNTTSDSGDTDFTDCKNGSAGEYPCNNVGLYAVVTPQELLAEDKDGVDAGLNDIWGWTDPETGSEYALVGLTDGVAFVDITNPSEPVVVGKLQEPGSQQQKNPVALHHDEDDLKGASTWRDMKVYENRLYVVSDLQPSSHGMQVFDLAQLRNISNPPEIFTDDDNARYKLFANAHNLAINEETGFAYVVGSTSGEVCAERGGLHMIDLKGASPEFAGCYFDEEVESNRELSGYIHDTQCVIYNGPDEEHAGREICFSSAETALLITNVEDKENAETIAAAGYDGNAYAHQGWLTEDHRYFFMNDELDEIHNGHNTRTYVWNVEDLDNPQMTGFYEHPTSSIDHNLYIFNDIMYQANYTGGLRVLDVSNRDPESIVEIGFFDTTPNTSEPEFDGLWSVYPWFSDNKVVVSDRNRGLFILHAEP